MADKYATFEVSGPFEVPSNEMTPVVLEGAQAMGIMPAGPILHFSMPAKFEVLLEVAWDPSAEDGMRFSHTELGDNYPFHSEAIEAGVLVQLSGGRQLLRETTEFGPQSIPWMRLEVWQDSGRPVTVDHAALMFRSVS